MSSTLPWPSAVLSGNCSSPSRRLMRGEYSVTMPVLLTTRKQVLGYTSEMLHIRKKGVLPSPW